MRMHEFEVRTSEGFSSGLALVHDELALELVEVRRKAIGWKVPEEIVIEECFEHA